MDDKTLLQRLRSGLRRCSGWDSDKVARDRTDALNYYLQRPRGDEVAGKSKVVAGTLSSMVESTLAQMVASLVGERIAEYDSMGGDDEDQAQLESDAVQKLIMGENGGFLTLVAAIKDALLLRNGVVKIWVEKFTKVEKKKWRNVQPEAVPSLTQIPGAECEVTFYDPKKGTLEAKCTYTRRVFRCKATPLENFLYDADHDELNLQSIGLCGERHIDTRSELIARFPEKKALIEKFAKASNDRNQTANARKPGRWNEQSAPIDDSQENVEWFECYQNYDGDGDGIAERHRLCVGGKNQQTKLEDEVLGIVPFAAGTCFLMPHRFTGISQYDKLRQEQDLDTGLERALMENVGAVNRARVAVLEDFVVQEDIDNPRTTATMRVKGVDDVRKAVAAFTVPDNAAGILANMEHRRTVRAELGGAALEMATGQMQLNDRLGSQGLDRAYSVMEQLAELMTLIIAHSLVRDMWLIAHATLRAEWKEPIPVKVGGRWQYTNPKDWPARTSVTVKPGMSPGERARRVAMLLKNLEIQVQLAEKGMDGVLVTAEGYYTCLMDWLRMGDVPAGERYYLDPKGEVSQKNAAGKNEQAKKSADAQKAMMGQAVSLEQLRTAMDKYKADQTTEFNYWKETLLAQLKEAQIIGEGTIKLLQGKQSGDRERESEASEAANGKPAADGADGGGAQAGT